MFSSTLDISEKTRFSKQNVNINSSIYNKYFNNKYLNMTCKIACFSYITYQIVSNIYENTQAAKYCGALIYSNAQNIYNLPWSTKFFAENVALNNHNTAISNNIGIFEQSGQCANSAINTASDTVIKNITLNDFNATATENIGVFGKIREYANSAMTYVAGTAVNTTEKCDFEWTQCYCYSCEHHR